MQVLSQDGLIKNDNYAPMGRDGNISSLGYQPGSSSQVGSNFVGMQMRLHPVDSIALYSLRPEIGRNNPNTQYEMVDPARDLPFAVERERRPWDASYILPKFVRDLVESTQKNVDKKSVSFPSPETTKAREGYDGGYKKSYGTGDYGSKFYERAFDAISKIFKKLRQSPGKVYTTATQSEGEDEEEKPYEGSVANKVVPFIRRKCQEEQGGLEIKLDKAA